MKIITKIIYWFKSLPQEKYYDFHDNSYEAAVDRLKNLPNGDKVHMPSMKINRYYKDLEIIGKRSVGFDIRTGQFFNVI